MVSVLTLGILMFFFRGNDYIPLIGTGFDIKFHYLIAFTFLLVGIGIVMILPRTPLIGVSITATVIIVSIVLYFPFYITFEGNASGIYPLRGILSRPIHLGLIWGHLGSFGGHLGGTLGPPCAHSPPPIYEDKRRIVIRSESSTTPQNLQGPAPTSFCHNREVTQRRARRRSPASSPSPCCPKAWQVH